MRQDLAGGYTEFSGSHGPVPGQSKGWNPDDFNPNEFDGVGLMTNTSGDAVPARKRFVFTRGVVMLIIANLAVLILLAYLLMTPPAAAIDSLEERRLREEERAAQQQTSSPAPVRGSSGGWRRSYVPRNDISDIFCRPYEGEPEETWAARVPSHCLSSQGRTR